MSVTQLMTLELNLCILAVVPFWQMFRVEVVKVFFPLGRPELGQESKDGFQCANKSFCRCNIWSMEVTWLQLFSLNLIPLDWPMATLLEHFWKRVVGTFWTFGSSGLFVLMVPANLWIRSAALHSTSRRSLGWARTRQGPCYRPTKFMAEFYRRTSGLCWSSCLGLTQRHVPFPLWCLFCAWPAVRTSSSFLRVFWRVLKGFEGFWRFWRFLKGLPSQIRCVIE